MRFSGDETGTHGKKSKASVFDVVEYLISNGADTLIFDVYGRSPLHYACIMNSDKKVVQLILDYNKEMDQYRAHTKENLEEFKKKAIINYDCVP